MALHALRRRCRWLRYAAELDRALFGGRASAVQCFKDLQDILGSFTMPLVLAGMDCARSRRLGGPRETRNTRLRLVL